MDRPPTLEDLVRDDGDAMYVAEPSRTEAFLSRIIEQQQDELHALRKADGLPRRDAVESNNNDLVMEISISTFIDLENALLTMKKLLLQRDVTISQLRATLADANDRADATQTEYDTLRREHHALRLSLEAPRAKPKDDTSDHALCRRAMHELDQQRQTLVKRCRLLALEAARYRHHQERLKAQWSEATQAVDHLQLHRQQQLDTIHDLQAQVYAFQAKQTTTKASSSMAVTSSSTMTEPFVRSDVATYEVSAVRTTDLQIIAAQNHRIEALEAEIDGLRRQGEAVHAQHATATAAHATLRRRANVWKGCIYTLLSKHNKMLLDLQGALKARDLLQGEKRQYIADYKKRKAQMVALQATLEAANDQLEKDQSMLAEHKTRIRYYSQTIRHNAERMRALIATCEAMQTKLETIQGRYQRSNVQRKQLAAQSSTYKSLLHDEKREREAALVEIEAFRNALVQVCHEAIAPPPQWTVEHVQTVTGIAEPLVYG
ncbi:hypothetical protein SPRG_06503 [Saprolegnia parasitica CBS 223.65]|uniref:Uncharacterized protein n=1 Tax=Saprolegnia parasitica (strain CBS 223.65) TaxID=695850 RepID=A0A067CD18_SAPPC|nr:hypothetical protein SPRG_06503 [Saprolegnia parasitica CBS 223.65]KDO28649.1 hypothetical protein SPRG_06503 [Saprolegnia parasitica CBS 223.65]|eukprot:XP_012200710.1 hypothetical protein SPRG_06503 [Saprolegnia parasitica CBS 223.65]